MEELLDMWLPDLISLEQWKTEDPSYNAYGWDALTVPTDCTYVQTRMATLGTRFLERYGFRMLNAETLPKWQIRLQNKFDEVVDKWNRAYELYDINRAGMMVDIKTGQKTVFDGQSQASGSDNNTRTTTSKSKDSPDSEINQDDDYADRYAKGTDDNTVNYGRKDVTSNTAVTEQTGILLENVNKTIRNWEDIDTEFVKEFENNFLNVFYY